MKRIIVLIERHEALRALAAESRAFEHFKGIVGEFDVLIAEEPRTSLEARGLEARLVAIRRELHGALQCIAASAALIPEHVLVLPALDAPSPRLTTCQFEAAALSVARAVAPHLDLFIEYGLHPSKLDDILRLVAEMSEVDLRLRLVEVEIDTFPVRLAATRERARKRARQLYHELKPVLDAGARAEWRKAAALGRAHRPRRLVSAPPLEQLPPGETTVPESDTTRPKPRRSGFARSMMLRMVGSDDRAGDGAASPDARVEEIARLKSSND